MSGRRLALAACIVLMPIGTMGQTAPKTADPKARAAQEDNIREAILRYEMLGWIAGAHAAKREMKDPSLDFETFFVSLNHKDPTADFLRRFRDIPRTVKKKSPSSASAGGLEVYDPQTHKNAIVFTADTIRWLSDDLVEVDGGYDCGGRCGAVEVFTLQHVNGVFVYWVVKQVKRTSIS